MSGCTCRHQDGGPANVGGLTIQVPPMRHNHPTCPHHGRGEWTATMNPEPEPRPEDTEGPEHAAYHRAITAASVELSGLMADPETSLEIRGATPSMLAQIAARPVWEAAMEYARDAEPTTVTAEQIEKAAKDLAWHLNEWEDGQIVWDPSEVAEEIEDCKPLAELVLRAAGGFRIEGDPA